MLYENLFLYENPSSSNALWFQFMLVSALLAMPDESSTSHFDEPLQYNSFTAEPYIQRQNQNPDTKPFFPNCGHAFKCTTGENLPRTKLTLLLSIGIYYPRPSAPRPHSKKINTNPKPPSPESP